LFKSRRQSSSASFLVNTVKVSPAWILDVAAGDNERSPDSPDGDKDKVLYLEFVDLMADDRCSFIRNDLEDTASGDRGELLELRVFGPVVRGAMRPGRPGSR